MFLAAAATPRKKLPPPATRPIWTPVRATSATSLASAATRPASMPNEPSPASTSPLSFNRMRPYLGTALLIVARRLIGRLIAHLEPRKARHRDVLSQLRD